MGSYRKSGHRSMPKQFIQPQRCIRSKSGGYQQPDPEIIINAKKLNTILNALEGFSE